MLTCYLIHASLCSYVFWSSQEDERGRRAQVKETALSTKCVTLFSQAKSYKKKRRAFEWTDCWDLPPDPILISSFFNLMPFFFCSMALRVNVA